MSDEHVEVVARAGAAFDYEAGAGPAWEDLGYLSRRGWLLLGERIVDALDAYERERRASSCPAVFGGKRCGLIFNHSGLHYFHDQTGETRWTDPEQPIAASPQSDHQPPFIDEIGGEKYEEALRDPNIQATLNAAQADHGPREASDHVTVKVSRKDAQWLFEQVGKLTPSDVSGETYAALGAALGVQEERSDV